MVYRVLMFWQKIKWQVLGCDSFMHRPNPVIPAKAGIQLSHDGTRWKRDSRLRGNDGLKIEIQLARNYALINPPM
jgi:hypothetical protein